MMEIYYIIVFFILGAILGSFYNVVGYRLPKGESIVFPSSHCPNCGHNLKPYELVPIFSFLFLKGKCSKCKQKISWFYTIFEILTGLLFVLCYLVFKDNVIDLIISLTFVSMLIIIFVSDFHYLIIPDSVLLISSIILLVELIIKSGLNNFYVPLLNGIISFIAMYLIKLLGDFIFKKESMGGGDIKLLFVIGMVLGFSQALFSIFVGSLVGLPIAFIILLRKKDHVIPFGPLLGIGAIIVLLTQFNVIDFFNSMI
ncbi:MAG: prepilin peptidase [Bacilli bacterium]|nr:prepilin peptidase [Bacilli bacterium]